MGCSVKTESLLIGIAYCRSSFRAFRPEPTQYEDLNVEFALKGLLTHLHIAYK
jgi:hypothetical protein